MRCSFRHVVDYLGKGAKVVKLGPRLDEYVAHRREEGAADASIRIELALLDRALKLAVEKRLLSQRNRPHIQKPPEDEARVRKGFFRRTAVERLCGHLPGHIAAVVTFLFFCPWRIGAARRLEWRDYSEAGDSGGPRAHARVDGRDRRPGSGTHAPSGVEQDEARAAEKTHRRPDCPFIFPWATLGMARFDRHGNRRPCLGDFQKVWNHACAAIGITGRTPHDLRRSGVKHYIDAGVDPHTVMQWSGHRTESMLRRYHIIDIDDLRRAGKKASDYRGPKENVIKSEFGRTAPGPSKIKGHVGCRG